MKGLRWRTLLMALCSLTPGSSVPVTFFIKHVSDGADKEAPSFWPQPNFNRSGVSSFPTTKYQSRVYPGHVFGDDFGTYSGDDFPNEINEFEIASGGGAPHFGQNSEDYEGTTGANFNAEPEDPAEYQNYYSSAEEEKPPPPREEVRDYDDEDDSGPINYEVEEKIPNDLKYKPPKVKVYPLPPPCLGATPPPWPTPPPPPKPSPKPGSGGGSGNGGGGGGTSGGAGMGGSGGGSDGWESGYYLTGYPKSHFPSNKFDPTSRGTIKYSSPNVRYYKKPRKAPQRVYRQPYLIRQLHLPSGPVLVRVRSAPSVRLAVRPPTKRVTAVPKKKVTPRPIVKEIHIHHHHVQPPAIVPVYPVLNSHGHPVQRSDQTKISTHSKTPTQQHQPRPVLPPGTSYISTTHFSPSTSFVNKPLQRGLLHSGSENTAVIRGGQFDELANSLNVNSSKALELVQKNS